MHRDGSIRRHVHKWLVIELGLRRKVVIYCNHGQLGCNTCKHDGATRRVLKKTVSQLERTSTVIKVAETQKT